MAIFPFLPDSEMAIWTSNTEIKMQKKKNQPFCSTKLVTSKINEQNNTFKVSFKIAT